MHHEFEAPKSLSPSPLPLRETSLIFELLKDWFVQIPLPPSLPPSLPPPLPQGKISDRYFLHIDLSLKPRPCRPFVLSYLLTKVNYLPENSLIF